MIVFASAALLMTACAGTSNESEDAGTGEASKSVVTEVDLNVNSNEGWELQPPAPFTAEEIAKGTPEGTTYLFLVSNGERQIYMKDVFGHVEGELVRYQSHLLSPNLTLISGERLGEGQSNPRSYPATWQGFAVHGEFSRRGMTRRKLTEIYTALGKKRVWLYEFNYENQDNIERYWFALDMPGQPILVEKWQGGALRGKRELSEYVRG